MRAYLYARVWWIHHHHHFCSCLQLQLQQPKKLRWKKYRSRHLHLLMHARHILGSLLLSQLGERSLLTSDDFPWFSTYLTTMSDDFYLITSDFGASFWPTYPQNGHHEWMFPKAASWLARQRLREWRGESACLRATSWLPAWVLAESSKIHAYLSFCRPWSHSIWCDCCITSFYLGFKKWDILWNTTKQSIKIKIKPLTNTMLNSPANTGKI